MAALQAHLERLRLPLPALQQAAVAGVFDAVARTPGPAPAARQDAVTQCLQCGHLAAVEAAVHALLQTDPTQLGDSPQNLLLAALVVAPVATAPPLAIGLLELFAGQPAAGGGYSIAAPGTPANWRTHPISKALLANPGAAQPLVLGVTRLLLRAAGSADSAVLDRTLSSLQPFLSLVLLDPALQQQHPALAHQLHGALARLASCAPSAGAQAALLRLLVAHLPALRLQGADSQAAASLAVADVLDALEACAEEPDAATVGGLAAALACLCHEAAAVGAAALLQQLLAALSHLASYWPHLVAPCAASLAMLLVQQQSLGSTDMLAVLALLARLLQHLADSKAASSNPQPGLLAPLLLLPLLQHVAFGGSKDVKQWAGHTLGLLRQFGGTDGGSSIPATMGLHGEASAAQAAQQLLAQLWQRPLEARHWLASLRSTLAILAAATAAGSGSSGGGRAAREQQQLDSGALLVLSALLQHPEEAVASAALQAAAAAVKASPLLGLTLLPLLLHQLQGQVELFLSGKRQRPSRLLLELLRTLPAMGGHPATLPFVLRTLQQLLSPDAPEALQAAGLRLMSRLWQASGGRAYPQLRAAVIGFAAPGQQPGIALRVARAECLRDICLTDPDKAVELVGLLQECLSDEAPAVQAIALDCIALLCEADVLEFYAAWRVVHRALPRLPAHPVAAAAWVRLLGCGGLDAAVQPDAAAAIIDALWVAAGHEAPEVRRQAYASLAAFSCEAQEGIGALRPLWHFAALLRREHQQQRAAGAPGLGSRKRQQLQKAAAECETLVQAALVYEHATRRRAAAAGPAAGSGTSVRERAAAATSASSSGAAALSHRLQSVLPKQLLGGSAASAAELLQRLPEAPAAAVLYFCAPQPPPANASKAVAAAAARQAAADYQAVFRVVLRQPPPSAAAAEDAGAAAEVLSAWSAFLRRWLAAERAASRQQEAGAQQAATDAALRVWQVVQDALQGGTPGSAASAVWAAAALCGCTPQPLPQLVTAVHAALLGLTSGQGQPAAAVQRAALAALGSVAEAVRLAIGISAAGQLVRLLQGRFQQQQAAAAGDLAAAATGLGLACKAAGGAGASQSPAAEELLRRGLTTLLQALSTTSAEASAALAATAAADGLSLSGPQPALPAEALPAVALALAAAIPAAAPVLALPSLLRGLHQLLAARLVQPAAAGEAPTTAACCTLLQAVAAAGFATSTLTSSDVSSSLSLLLSTAAGTSAAADGRLVGAAAAAAGGLLTSALQRGFAPGAAEDGAEHVLQRLLSVPEAAARLPHAASAKHGAASGLAALLTDGTVDSAASPHFKTAVAALEQLALQEPDPRTRRACALPLASLCYGVKRSKGLAATRGISGGSDASKGLQQLPADGVLRPLLESLLEGRWVLPGEDSEEHELLAAADAAAILRCAAVAPRLPATPLGSLGLRLLRSHGTTADGEAVEQALFALVAAHGSQPQTGLASLVPELLSGRTLRAACSATQLSLLRYLPQLLAALPDAEAARLLQQVAQLITAPGTAAAAAAHHQCVLLLQLLRSLAALLEGGSTGSSAEGSTLRGAAAGVLEDLLLKPRLMPLPLPYAQLQAVAAEVTASDDSHAAAQPSPLSHRCWAAALRCLQQLPHAQRDALLQHPALPPAAAALAAAGLVAAGVADASLLQHPRNLLLQGGSSAGGKLRPSQQALAALHLGRAVATLPPGAQQQWLLEVLEACKACSHPVGALQLSASIIASSAAVAAAAGDAHRLAADVALPASAAVQNLPITLPRLLAAPTWQRNSASMALLLQRLTSAVQHLEATQASPEHPAPMPCSPAGGWQALLRCCLLAVRHNMPTDSWPTLAALL